MEELEYKPLTRTELEVVDLNNYFTFSTIATEQFGKTRKERLAIEDLANRNARVFAVNLRYPQPYKEACKTLEDMRRQILLGLYDAKMDADIVKATTSRLEIAMVADPQVRVK